jgi:ferredoxin-NADP reductase
MTAPTAPATLGRLRERVGRLAELVATPLVPADYVDLIDPLRSGTDLRGRIVEVRPETRDAATLVIRPGRGWRPHVPGQYVRLGVDVDGVRQWRAYSLTSDTTRTDGCISVTVKAMPDGKVSNHLVRRARPGLVVQLDQAAGEFVLPSPVPAQVLFVTAGSGITPVMGMLRNAVAELEDVVLVHSSPTADDVIFAGELRALAAAGRIRLVERHTEVDGVLTVDALAELVPDLAQRQTWACGPTGMLDALEAHWEARGIADRMHTERFRPALLATGEGGTGHLQRDRPDARGRRRDAAAGRRRGRRCPHAVGLPHGHLLRLRRPPALRHRARPARRRHHHRGRGRRGARADVHLRRRRRLRPRALTRPPIRRRTA